MDNGKYLYDVSMSYVNPGWHERYCSLVREIDTYLKGHFDTYFADLQLYQTGPMNYVVVAVYKDVPGVREALPQILKYVNAKYRQMVGHNVRRKQILKFDLAKRLPGQDMVNLVASEDKETVEDSEQSRTNTDIEEGDHISG